MRRLLEPMPIPRQRTKNKLLTFSATVLLGLSASLSVRAGDVQWNFDTDPATDPAFTGALFAGNQGFPNKSFWYSNNGNPDTGGYMAITDAVDSQNLVAAFPVVDTFVDPDDGLTKPTPLKAFHVSMDLRVGNGDERPADGFSVSFARLNDPILYWASRTNADGTPNPQARGTAGGDSLAQASQNAADPLSCDAGNFENGTKTGVAVVFDTWQGNWLPVNGVVVNGTSANDVEGIAVRVDDVTLIQVPIPTRNGACNDTNSMQTGPWDNSFSINGLCWQPLTIDLTADAKLTVTWKGAALLNNYDLTGKISLPMSGRLILMGRTGGNNENTHVDNVHVATTPAQEASLESSVGSYDGFTFVLKDLGASQVAAVTKVLLDDTNDVTSATVVTKSGTRTTGKYSAATWLTSRSAHKVTLEFRTTVGQTLTAVFNFTVPLWQALPTNLALTQGTVSGPGFTYNSFQTKAVQPNTLRFAEETVIGLHGKNYATAPSGTYNGVVNFGNNLTAGAGVFTNEVRWTTFGIPDTANFANEDNSGIELFSYVYFPTSGVYQMYVGSDDGFRLTTAKNSKDRMGTEIYSFNGGRGVGNPGDLIYLKIDAPGAYPMRLLMENGGGGSDLEWYFKIGGTNVLVNDSSNPNAIMAYQTSSSAGPYVKSANPVRDGQNVVFYQPIVIELGDGTGTMAVNASTVALTVDGTTIPITATKTGDTTLVKQTSAPAWAAGNHTIVLTFKDQAATDYSYTWNFRVINLSTYPVVQIPATNAVPLANIDQTKPGVLIRPYQTTTASPNTMWWTEEQLMGLHGQNTAFVGAGPGGSTPWDGPIDFSGNTDASRSTAEWTYNFDLAAVGIDSAFTGNYDNSTLDIGCWIQFPNAGKYAMVVNSDDGFLLTSPYANPFNRAGAVQIGRFDGGRGSSGPPGDNASGPRGGLDYMVIEIPAPGVYPFRLVWENGGGGAGFEWSIYQLLPNGGVTQMLINDTNQPSALKVFQRTTSLPPSIYVATPLQNSTVLPTSTVVLQLADGDTTVNEGSIAIKVNGVTRTATVTRTGDRVDISINAPADFWAAGTNLVELTYADSGGVTRTYSWVFNTAYTTLPLALKTPVGSGSNPGFQLKVFQSSNDDTANNILSPSGWNNLITMANQAVAGLMGPNVANLGTFTHDGYAWNSGVINYSQNDSGAVTQNGNFRDTSTPPMADVAFPGLPGSRTVTPIMNDDAMEVKAFVEFPTAGLYIMGVNSDDGFRVTVGDSTAGKTILKALAPASVAGEYTAIETQNPPNAFGGDLPMTPLIAQAVLADPLLAGGPLNNAAVIRGKIAIVQRGTYTFKTKCKVAQDAGAIAVIVVNSAANAGKFPSVMGDDTTITTPITIPCLFVSYEQGTQLINAATTTAASPLVLDISDDTSLNLGEANVGKGSSDVTFAVKVPEPGVWPLRLIWFNGGGDANLEWFTQDPVTGVKTLVNDPAGTVKAYIARTAPARATINQPVVVGNGAGVAISWTGQGELETALSPSGPWIKSQIQTNPAVFPTIPGMQSMFFRVRTY